jgi:hypothetical protein
MWPVSVSVGFLDYCLPSLASCGVSTLVHVFVPITPVKVWLAFLGACHLRVVQEVESGVETTK